MKRAYLALILASLMAGGCVTATSASISQIPPKDERKNIVRARSTSPIIFGFHFGTGYLDDAHEELLEQCADGAIEGIMAKHETTNYFIALVEVYAVNLQGYCVGRKGSKKA